MAIIRPFKALRPPVHLAPHVASLPYDVMDVEEARLMAKGNPDSFLHVSRPEIDLPASVDPYSDEVHEQGKKNLHDFIERKLLIQDPSPCYYIYRQRVGSIIQTGLVACAAVDDYQSGVIKKHEQTRADKETDRIRHSDLLNANDEPVFYIFRKHQELEDILLSASFEPPDYNFDTSDGVSHKFWVVADPDLIDHLTALFKNIPTLYVADGHHRSAAASKIREIRKAGNPGHTGEEEYNFFMTVIFPETQMNIMPYNRVVKDLNGMDESVFIEKLGSSFELEPSAEPVSPQNRHQFGMYLAGKWYVLNPKAALINENSSLESLDVSILQNYLLQPLLAIDNPRTNQRISFVGGIRGVDELVRLVDSGAYAVAFSLYPTSIQELISLSDQGGIMPPKSTWFEPKLRSGLFVHLLD